MTWSAESLLREGSISVLSGRFGSGKTALAVDLALSVMTGLPFAGQNLKRSGAVLWLGAQYDADEVDRSIIAAAVRRLGTLPRLPLVKIDHVPPHAGQDELIDAARSAFALLPAIEPALILVDPRNTYVGNSVSASALGVETLRRLSHSTGTGVVVVSHASASSRGFSILWDAADTVLLAADGRLQVIKARGAECGVSMPFNIAVADLNGDAVHVVDWQARAELAEAVA